MSIAENTPSVLFVYIHENKPIILNASIIYANRAATCIGMHCWGGRNLKTPK